jgi:hypothetical protein
LRGSDVGTKSACATAWPPLLASGKPTAGMGLTASQLATVARSGGRQVIYNGHPLYLYVGDKKPGDVTGQAVTAFGAAWFVLSPAGNQIAAGPPASGGVSSGGGGYQPASNPSTSQPWE